MDNLIGPRIGAFLIFIGSGFFCLFVLEVMGHQFHLVYFLLAVVSLFIGFRMRRKLAPPPRSGRFAIINKSREQMIKAREFRENRRKEREEKKKKK